MKSLRQQAGFFTLASVLLLVIVLITTLSVYRSSSVVTTISGNMAFKQAAIQYTDIGVRQALTQMNAMTSFDANITGQYYATELAQDANGLPSTINWASVPANNQNQFVVKQITERMCTGALPIVSLLTQCMTNAQVQGTSNNVGGMMYSPPPGVYYRVTVQVTGPSNTVSYVQAIILR